MASRLRAAALGVLLAASLAGCVSIPGGGPVESFTIAQSPGGQSQAFPQRYSQPPQAGWTPKQVVQGFIAASANLGDQQKTAREYLTPLESKRWNPKWSAYVYKTGPNVELLPSAESNPKVKGRQETAEVAVTGTVQATVQTSGSYAVASAKATKLPPFRLVRAPGGQWRISYAPPELLLTSYVFGIDYQQRNLYFFDPAYRVLVPDPVYVPLQATPAVLMGNLVNDLNSPPKDWLSRATNSAFPAGTSVDDVTLDGQTATVNLSGAALGKTSVQAREQVSSQLLWTLIGSGQGGPVVQSVQLNLNGKPWTPPGNQGSPVQDQPQYSPPPHAASGAFYYLDSVGNLLQQASIQGKTTRVARLGKAYVNAQIAVSPPQGGGLRYLAVLQGGALYTGAIGGKLKLLKRGTDFTSMSWAANGELWTTSNDQVFMLAGDVSSAQGPGQPIAVNVVNTVGNVAGPFNALRVAPDGVRVALVNGSDGSVLDFGAITEVPGARASQTTTKIVLSQTSIASPGNSAFANVAWYGPDNVVTLCTPGPLLTEYPVNGGTQTAIQPPAAQLQSITVSAGYSLIAEVAKDRLMAAVSLAGPWAPIGAGVSPVYPG